MSEPITRRVFLARTGAVALGMAAPGWLGAFAQSGAIALAKGQRAPTDRVLVVCQLGGGNDGLNALVPFKDPKYFQLRPNLGIAAETVLDIDGRLGLNPALDGLHRLFLDKRAAAVCNVGYPNPNRSHFRSMEIWQTAAPETHASEGWLGKYVANISSQGQPSVVDAVGLSTERPLALASKTASVPCFSSLDDIKAMAGDTQLDAMLRQAQKGSSPKDADAQKASLAALDAMKIIGERMAGWQPQTVFGTDPFGTAFRQAAQVVAKLPETRVVYISVGGFDTHARQLATQNRLLGNLGDALKAFDDEMVAIGKGDKTTVAVFSEFGRRTFENASEGTDHGAAGPVFLVGGGVNAGVHGSGIDLQNLHDGDLIYNVDFRDVYAELLGWMGADPKPILSYTGKPLGALKA